MKPREGTVYGRELYFTHELTIHYAWALWALSINTNTVLTWFCRTIALNASQALNAGSLHPGITDNTHSTWHSPRIALHGRSIVEALLRLFSKLYTVSARTGMYCRKVTPQKSWSKYIKLISRHNVLQSNPISKDGVSVWTHLHSQPVYFANTFLPVG